MGHWKILRGPALLLTSMTNKTVNGNSTAKNTVTTAMIMRVVLLVSRDFFFSLFSRSVVAAVTLSAVGDSGDAIGVAGEIRPNIYSNCHD